MKTLFLGAGIYWAQACGTWVGTLKRISSNAASQSSFLNLNPLPTLAKRTSPKANSLKPAHFSGTPPKLKQPVTKLSEFGCCGTMEKAVNLLETGCILPNTKG